MRAVRAGGFPPGRRHACRLRAILNCPGSPRLEGLPQPFRLPGRFGWLIRLVPGAAAYGGQVQYLLADPEMAALLADVPQAGRILRPLCRMLAIRLGPEMTAKRRRRSVSAAGPADSEGQPETRTVARSCPPRAIPPASPAAPPWQPGLAAT